MHHSRTLPLAVLALAAAVLTPAVPAPAALALPPAADQPPAAPAPAEPPAVRLAMDELGQLEGHWKGEGWIRMGPGEPSRFTSQETVESGAGGRVLVVHGLHKDAATGEVVHDALGILEPAEGGGYEFHTYLSNGRSGTYPARVEGENVVWEIDSPRGLIRYTIDIDDHRWHEVGDIQMDGKWNRFFEMTLQRVSEPRPRR